MNGIFVTQGGRLELFYQVMLVMKESMTLNKIGFYTADSRFFNNFKKECPLIESSSFFLLKEWEIVRESLNIKPDLSLLERYEKEIGEPCLWNALVADRRIYLGKKCAYAQDYKPRFDHEGMLAALQIGLQRMEDFFDKVQPDFIVSFQCVTIGEYLSYLFAKARGIPLLNLRPSRIQNYVYAGEDILEPSKRLNLTYQYFLENGIDPSLKNEAAGYLEDIRETNAMYEGVIPPSSKPPGSSNKKKQNISNLFGLRTLTGLLIGEYQYRFGKLKGDNHANGYIDPFINQHIVRPLRAGLMEKIFKHIYMKEEDLQHLKYAFFPLHPEPEVTVYVYSKPYLNQIEAIRLISHNLPVGMKLIVKEHPWHVGKRTISYYRKLLQIPNVMLAPPEMKSRNLVSKGDLVTVISGSIGLEGLMLNVPVIVLGRAPFNFLPNSMMRHVTNPDSLGFEIRDLLENYQYEERAMQCYIAAVMKDSVAVDFYSILSGRKEAYNPNYFNRDEESGEIERKRQIKLLSDYLKRRYEEFKAHSTILASMLGD